MGPRTFAAFAALMGCTRAHPMPAPPAPPGVAPPAVSAVALSPPSAASVVVERASRPPEPEIAAPEPPFPPPSFAPLHARTAKPGDGVWKELAGGVLFQSMVHPDSTKPHIDVALVAVDLRRVDLRLVAGTREPLSKTVPADRRPGLVPAADQARLLAVFNGGFMARHGGWGMMIGGEVFLPPREDGCTVALLDDGGVRIRTFSELGDAKAHMVAYRQTPPCLVERRAIYPALLGGAKPRRWGMSESGGIDIRRSAIGLADGGRTLLYGLGEWVTPRALAESMSAAGAVDAAELDVNWSFTRFILYGEPSTPGDPPEVKGTLVPKIKYAADEYVHKPAERDFFYLARKPAPRP